MRKFLTRLLLKLVELDLSSRNDQAEKAFLLEMSESAGFKSYLAVRDYYLLKELGRGLKDVDYWVVLGQRKELMMMKARADETKNKVKNKHNKEVKYSYK